MQYINLVHLYEKLGETSKRLDKTYYLAEFLKNIPDADIPTSVLLLRGRVFPEWDDQKIGIAARMVLKSLNVTTGISVVDLEKRWKNIGDLGEVAQEVVSKKKQATLFSETLTVAKVFKNIQKLATLEGSGSVDVKTKLIAELLSCAQPVEAKYVVRTLLEDLRVGVGDGTLRDSIIWSYFPHIEGVFVKPKGVEEKVVEKKALEIDDPEKLLTADFKDVGVMYGSTEKKSRELYAFITKGVQHAFNLTNDFSRTVLILRSDGLKGLFDVDIELFNPIRLMLYEKAAGIEEAFKKVGKPAAFEYKYDGFRIEIHKKGDDIRLFTRNFENVSKQFPDVVEVVREHVKVSDCILDSEAVGYDVKTTQYLPFQSVSQRIKRKHNIKEMSEKFPVEVNVFDIIYHEGKSTLDMPFMERRGLLNEVVDAVDRKIVLSRITITDNVDEARTFYDEALDKGNEGVMAKNLEAVYTPGKRVGFGVKVKPVMESLDVVIVGAEWGTGKRANWLTSFTVACSKNGEMLELGKVGTGIKELEGEGVTFDHLTKLLKPLVISESGKSVVVKPSVVVELHYEEIQKSGNYSSGYALRFPRVIRLREDRGVNDCSTLELVETLYYEQRGRGK